LRQMRRRGIISFSALVIISFTIPLSEQANATVPFLGSSDASSTGPGYELQVSNAVYGFNAPRVNSLPNNPTGGVQKCFTAIWGTCTAVGLASTGDYTSPGYWAGSTARVVATNGQVQYGGEVFGFGNTDTCNQVSTVVSNAPVVGIASAQFGALLVAADGGVFAFCGAQFYGSMGGQHLNDPVVGIAATPDGKGYWLVASDGGVFTFGDAGFYGSMGGQHLNQPMVAIAANPDGTGYWTAAADGGVFAFGDAPFRGSATGSGTLEGIAANG
jgi:hypothetical protein